MCPSPPCFAMSHFEKACTISSSPLPPWRIPDLAFYLVAILRNNPLGPFANPNKIEREFRQYWPKRFNAHHHNGLILYLLLKKKKKGLLPATLSVPPPKQDGCLCALVKVSIYATEHMYLSFPNS